MKSDLSEILDEVLVILQELQKPSALKVPKNWRDKISCRDPRPAKCYACSNVFCRHCEIDEGNYHPDGTWFYICKSCLVARYAEQQAKKAALKAARIARRQARIEKVSSFFRRIFQRLNFLRGRNENRPTTF